MHNYTVTDDDGKLLAAVGTMQDISRCCRRYTSQKLTISQSLCLDLTCSRCEREYQASEGRTFYALFYNCRPVCVNCGYKIDADLAWLFDNCFSRRL
jgi:hypothetical protein